MDAGPSRARVRPTASARRRRTHAPEVIEVPEDLVAPSPPDETADEDIPAMDVDDDSADGPCPGGPEDDSVLRSFRTHIAASIWRQEVNRCYTLHYLICYFDVVMCY